jgi:DNA-binding Lrp family transcriptional regulator
MTGSKKAPTPSTHQFITYLEEEIRPLLTEKFSRPQVSVLIDLLRFLEQQRYDFSADRAFQTRPISNAAIADQFGVTERSVRRWIAQLEGLGILERQKRKNPHHAYKNLLNRIGFSSFCGWFRALLAKIPDNQCPPKKKDIINISISSKNPEGKKKPDIIFPTKGSIRYDRFWRETAETYLPSGRGRPCMDMIAARFRENLKFHLLAFDHPSVANRWIKFCQRAKPVS